MKMTLKLSALAMIGVLTLSGCISLLPEPAPAPSIYRLSGDDAEMVKRTGSHAILIRKPEAPTALKGPEITLSPDGRRIAYAENAEWEAPIPYIVQQTLIDGFAGSELLHPVVTTSGVRADYAITISVRSFEAVFINGEKNAPESTVVLTATLTDMSERGLLGSKTVSKRKLANAREVSQIVIAQEGALREAVMDLVTWAEMTVQAQNEKQPL